MGESARFAELGDGRATPPMSRHVQTLEQRLVLASWTGDIPNGTVWANTEVQRIVGNVHVPTGATLTIQPGTLVKFDVQAGYSITVDGTVIADGTAGQPIVFTSFRDDSGLDGILGTADDQDSNANGATDGGNGDWNRLDFKSGSTGNILDNVQVRFGGASSLGSLIVDGAGLNLTNSLVRNSSSSGVRIQSSNPTLTTNSFQNSFGAAISMDLASNPAITGVTVTNNAANALVLDAGTLTGSRFWNDSDIVYRLTGDVTVAAGSTLTVGAGQVVKFRTFAGDDLLVDGTLTADGTAALPIVFTSDRDDTSGGDTNNNGVTDGNNGDWNAIRLQTGSSGHLLDNVQIRFGGGNAAAALEVSVPITLSNSVVRNSFASGVRLQTSNSTLTTNSFLNNATAAISMDLSSNPAITGVTVTNNGANALILDTGTLVGNGFWDDRDIVYRLTGDVTVPLGSTLTVGAGQIVKFRTFAGDDLLVDGRLIADGTAALPIIFTSDRDDTSGGDTNNNGVTDGNNGDWNAIRLQTGSSGHLLDNVQIRFGGGNAAASLEASVPMTLSNSVVRNSFTSGVRLQTSNSTLTTNSFLNNATAAISMDLASNPAITGVTVTNNGANALILDSGTLTGNGFWDDRDIVYRLSGDVTVPLGSTLTIGAGQIVKFRTFAGDDVLVDGTLTADGTEALPIIFTSDRDDTSGGDTNNNGITDGNNGDWNAIQLRAGSSGHLLDNVQIRFGGGSGPAALVASVPMTLSNSVVRNSFTSGVRLQTSNSTLTTNSFQNNSSAAISMDLASNPAISGVTVANNGANALALDAGSLIGNGFWDDRDIVYRLTGDVTVPQGSTLTVGEGQIVKFRTFAGDDLLVDGILKADGTAALPIIFTSDRDDSVGGDTNNNGLTDGNNGDWNAIRLQTGSSGHLLDNVQIRFGGSVALAALEASVPMTLTNSVVRNSVTSGVRLQTSDSTLLGNTFTGSSVAAISMDLASNPTISGSTVNTNVANALILDSGSLTKNVFWNGPDIVYRLTGDITVPQGRTLTVAAGQIVKFRTFAGDELIVNGTLVADGTLGLPITFTSDRDDLIGGDTNNNGATTGNNGDWNAIRLEAGSSGSVLDNVQIRFGGGGGALGSLVAAAPLTLSNSGVRSSATAGVRVQASNPTIANVTFESNSGAAVGIDLASDPQVSAAKVTGNGLNAIGVDAGTLSAHQTWSAQGLPYRLTGNTTIAAATTLTLAPGAIYDAVDFVGFLGTGTIQNNGTIRKTTGANTSTIAPAVINAGVVQSKSGTLQVSGNLTNNGTGYVDGVLGTTLAVAAGFLGDTHNTTLFEPEATVLFNGAGTAASPQLLEAMGQDRGNAASGFDHNFKFYVLSLSNSTYVRLVNASDNFPGSGSEAVYVDNLTIPFGTTLDTNGFHLYYRNASLGGTVIGTITQVADGGPLALDVLTPAKISAVGEIDDWTIFGRAGDTITVTVSTGSGGATPPINPTLNFARVRLFDANNNQLANAANAVSGADVSLAGITLPADGTYHIRVQAPTAQSSSTGNYVITAWDASLRIVPIELNRNIVGQLDTPFRIDRYTFSGVAGQVVQFQLLNAESPALQFDLTGPSGFTAFSNTSSSSDLITLPSSGTYSVNVHGTQRQTGAYAFRIEQTTVTDLTLGTPLMAPLAGGSQSQVFRVTVPTSQQLRFTLTDAAVADRHEVYVQLGSAPTRENHQYRSTTVGANQRVTVPSAAPGDWFVLVYTEAAPVSGSFALKAEVGDVFLTSVTPDHHSNTVNAVLTLEGSGFDNTTSVSLVNGGGMAFTANSVHFDTTTQVTATFSGGSLPAGVYSVQVARGGGTSVTLPNAFTFIEGGQAQLEANVVVPSAIGYHIPAVVYIEYSNTGNAAMPAPILFLRPTQTHANGVTDAKAFLTLDQSLVTAGFWTSAEPAGFSNTIQILATGSTPGVLQPGESRSIPVYYAGWQQPWDLTYPSFDYQLIAFRADDPTPMDLASMKEDLKPTGIETNAWDTIFSNLLTLTGSTVGQYVTSLGQNAAYLGQLGVNVNDIGRLLAFEVAQAEGIGLASQIGSTVDAGATAPGAPLAFSRAFVPGISGRSRLGSLGRGWAWTGPWETRLSVATDGTVTIAGPDGSQRSFQPDSRGGYFASLTDLGTLTDTGGGTFRVQERDGVVRTYRADGRFNFVEDTNHNRLTAGYTGNLVTSLIHSSGQTILIGYNGAGRITTVTDPTGRITTYTYDASNEHLLRATAFDGQATIYTYSTLDGPAKRNSLLSITTSDGVRESFGYDSRGRLNDIHFDGNANQVTFSYGPHGTVSATNAAGGTSTYFFDDHGLILKTEDPLDRNAFYRYDNRLQLTQATDQAGQFYNYSYDKRRRLTQATDPLGGNTLLSYGGPFEKLTALTDARGNTTRYSYDANGNVLGTSYPDGTVESATYNPLGHLATSTNQRGQVVAYTYDTSGRLLTKTFADGTQVVLSYNARGTVSTVTDTTGTTNYTYDASDRLTQITFPGGRFLKYTYDVAGRRTRMEDQSGFKVNYAYDALSRLASLTDTSGTNVATYSYDAIGFLRTKTNGNGSSTTYVHDVAGQLTQVVDFNGSQQVIAQFDYTYDVLGRRVTMRTLEGLWTYSYDAISQLTRAVFASNNVAQIPHQDLAYHYDAAGNRTSTVINGVTTGYVTNSMNQYTSVGSATYGYDADGNLVRKTDAGVTTTMTYDTENHLVGLSEPGDSWSYQYDAVGNVIVTTHNGETVESVTDPTGLGNVVGEYSAGGTLLRHYIHGGELVSRRESAGAASYFQYDGIGNTVAITTAGGVVSSSYSYLPFGERLKTTNSTANAFQLGGAFGVSKGGGKLDFMRARAYDPAVGRFVESDPIGTAGGLNLYRFGSNNPVSNVDPSGLGPGPIVLSQIYELVLITTRMGLAAEAEAIFFAAGAPTAAGTANGVVFNTQQIISGLRGLIGRGVTGVVSSGASGLAPGITIAAPGVTIAAPAVTIAAPGVTIAAPGVTIAAPGAAAAGAATEVAVGTEIAIGTEIVAAEGIGGAGLVAGGSLVIAAGIGGAIVGTIINEAVLSNDTKDIIGDTLLGIWESAGRLPGYLSGSRTPRSTNVASVDPNDKIGPSGFGVANFIALDSTLTYRIDFENDASATAPAQRVAISDQLSSSYDLSTFQLADIRFGDTIITVPAGSQHYQTTLPLIANGKDFDLQIEVGLRSQTGKIFATFQSIDPTTELPPDVLTGFLPPEDGEGHGQGYITYSIRLKPTLATGTEIRNIALITFDSNLAIATDQVDPHDPSKGVDPAKQAFNTIDAVAPLSTVAALPAETLGGAIALNWSGADDDGGSGVASFDIFVSEDDGPFVPFTQDSTATSGTFAGSAGHTYRFYSVATDNVGNLEAAPALADATTTTVNAVSVGTNAAHVLQVTDVSGTPNNIVVTINPAGTMVVLTSMLSELFLVGTTTRQTVIEVPIANVTSIAALLGDGDDSFSLSTLASPSTLDGGSGNDSLTGGTGNDLLTGGLGADSLTGGTGTDTLRETADLDMALTSTSLASSVTGQAATTDVLNGFEAAFLTGGPAANRLDASTFVVGAGLGVTLIGAAGNDSLISSSGRDSLVGDDGDDTINAGSGNDIVLAGVGRDSVTGSAGADNISGGDGIDTVFGGTGNDTIDGGLGNDVLNGQDNDDSILGGDGNDKLTGDVGNDILRGGLGNDTLKSNAGDDQLFGDEDIDSLIAGDGLDRLEGGSGNDVLRGEKQADTLLGGTGTDSLVGGADNDSLDGGDDNDTLVGDFGNDTLLGGNNDDRLTGFDGNDQFDGGAGADFVTETGDTDIVVIGTNFTSVFLGTDTTINVERLNLSGGASANKFDARAATLIVRLFGNDGNDTLLGGSKVDSIVGGNGDDVLGGGASNDVIDGGAGSDFFYEKSDANVTITNLQVVSSGTGTETLIGIENIALVGGTSANTLNAASSSVPVILLGGLGNDTLTGSAFNDVLVGGNRADSAGGTDSLTGGSGADTFDNDPADTRDSDVTDSVIANVFASPFPVWLDVI